MVQKAVHSGLSVWNVLQVACVNPVLHYSLPVGLLQVGDPADFIVVSNLEEFEVQTMVIDGKIVLDQGSLQFPVSEAKMINHFEIDEITLDDIQTASDVKTPVISVTDGQIITERLEMIPTDGDVLKIVCINRYHMSKPAIAYVHGFGLKEGAIGSSVAHDSHNILAVGTNDIDILRAVNRIIKSRGGVVATSSVKQAFLPLPIAGLMSNLQGLKVYEAYSHVEQTAKEFGSTLTSPLMTLSFMALLVIPKLKLSDKGLFDAEKFQFIVTPP
jgi:adenine deaminase